MKREKLLEALANVKPGIAAKDTIEQSGSFILNADEIYTFNADVAACVRFPIGVTCAVPATGLYKLLQKMEHDDVTLEIVKGVLVVTSGKFIAKLKIEEELKLPFHEKVKADPKGMTKFTWDNSRFTKAMKFCLFTVSNDSQYMQLCCLHVSSDNRGCYMESTDRFRVTRRYFTKTPFPGLDLLIPAQAAKELSQYKIETWGKIKGWLHFGCEGGVLFASNTVEESFPDPKEINRGKNVLAEIELPEEFEKVLDRASVMAEKHIAKDESVNVEISNGVITVRSQGDAGWFKETCDVAYKGEQVSFVAHPEFLADMVRLGQTIRVYKDKMEVIGKGFWHVARIKA